MRIKPTGYCIVVIGRRPIYRIIFKSTLDEVRKTLSSVSAKMCDERVEVLRMIDGDTLINEEEENYEPIES